MWSCSETIFKPKAQLIIADIPYNVGTLKDITYVRHMRAVYKDGDNKNGESNLARSQFFDTDKDFRVSEFMHFCTKMLTNANYFYMS